MSLTSFLKIPDVRKKFLREFPKPRFSFKGEMLAPPLTKSYPLQGTAFDYLMRFHLSRLNRKVVVRRRWVAESALELVKEARQEYDNKWLDRLCERCKKIISEAKKARSKLLRSGKIERRTLELARRLAQIDAIYRPHQDEIRDGDFGYMKVKYTHLGGPVEKENIADLKNLISIVDWKLFKAKRICALNPTFGKASGLVGGADADVIIDNTLIDMKTTKSPYLQRDQFNQVMGYYMLARIGGIDGVSPKPRITRVGIYYSRYGCLFSVSVKDVVDRQRFPAFLRWFKNRAYEYLQEVDPLTAMFLRI